MPIIIHTLKAIGSFCTAFCLLTMLFTFYGLIPVHIDNPHGNTDYIWPANSRWMKMSEGVSWGQVDANGFNNKTVLDNPDILIVGSSHMEAMNVMQDENTASQLNQLLNQRYSVYNLGISGHNFCKTCQYLPRNIELFKPKGLKAIIVETSTVDVSLKDVESILQQNIKKTPSHSNGLVGKLQRNPYLRTLYFQYEHGLSKTLSPPQLYNIIKKIRTKEKPTKSKSVNIMPSKESAYSKLFIYLADIQKEHHVRIIVFHHPFETLKRDGSIFLGDTKKIAAFSDAAIEHGVVFVDMSNQFEKMYYEEHHVPHGFITGKLGVGHLNAYGQATIAKELADVIMKLEREGNLMP